jgi:hypothetical protein
MMHSQGLNRGLSPFSLFPFVPFFPFSSVGWACTHAHHFNSVGREYRPTLTGSGVPLRDDGASPNALFPRLGAVVIDIGEKLLCGFGFFDPIE